MISIHYFAHAQTERSGREEIGEKWGMTRQEEGDVAGYCEGRDTADRPDRPDRADRPDRDD